VPIRGFSICNAAIRTFQGEADGLFVVQGRFLIHWPTFRAKQFKPLEKLPGQVPDFSEETENGVAPAMIQSTLREFAELA
jgi:hypothetical protein